MHIFGEHVLQQYWSEEEDRDPVDSFRRAFLRWGQEIIDGVDRLESEGHALAQLSEGIDRQALDLALEMKVGQRRRAISNVLRPLHKNGTTLRHIAAMSGLDLALVVHSLAAPNVTDHVAYCDMEDDLVANGTPTSWSALARKHGMHTQTTSMKHLAEIHGIEAPTPPDPWQKLRRESVALLDDGLTPSQAVRVLQSRYPDDSMAQRLKANTVYVWGKRKRQAVAA